MNPRRLIVVAASAAVVPAGRLRSPSRSRRGKPDLGPVTVTFEQFDPLSGWQFVRAVHTRATAGRASVRYAPPTEGRWRATASYDGTLGAAPSDTGFVRMLVGGPLTD